MFELLAKSKRLILYCLAVVIVSCLHDVTADDGHRRYLMFTFGWLSSEIDYGLDFNYNGKYDGYHTTSSPTPNCQQCSDPMTGLQERNIPFTGMAAMGLANGYSVSGEIGKEFINAISLGLEANFIARSEQASNDGFSTLDSNIWAILLNGSYALFTESTEYVKPYLSVGLGVMSYSGKGQFMASAVNSVRGVNGIPSILQIYGKFDSASAFSAVTKLKAGVNLKFGEAKEIDIGVQYLAANIISKVSDTGSNVNTPVAVTQDPGSAQTVSAGCNGNSSCNPYISRTYAEPVTFMKSNLDIRGIEIGNIIIDLGIKFYF